MMRIDPSDKLHIRTEEDWIHVETISVGIDEDGKPELVSVTTTEVFDDAKNFSDEEISDTLLALLRAGYSPRVIRRA